MTHRVESALRKIESRDAVVGVVGLGYVGLPVAATFAEAGFTVVGVDRDRERVSAIEEGRSHIADVATGQIRHVRRAGRLRASTTYRRLRQADAILICVPTPLQDGAPDLSNVVAAGRAISKVLKPGALVVLESTTYPGATEELLRPLLESGGLTAGTDFFLAFSPERIDPGNPLYAFGDIPKVVGGITDESTRAAALLYGQVVPKVVTVSGTKEAELTKLIENTFRHVNIALVNELAVYAYEMGVDIWEAIEAAATKPFGYMPFWPGPGWGGHCIPLDPSYLSWAVRRDRAHEVRFVELAQTVNSEMPRHVVERVSLMLNDMGKPLRDAKVMGVGIAYKGGTEDTRESAGLKVLNMLAKRGASLSYHDPLVPEVEMGGLSVTSSQLTAASLHEQDLVLILVPQTGVDWELIAEEASMTLDCCNALGRRQDNIVRI
jgi:UDP-N-acetyl-D-glucosamine dehydrogenase